MNPSVEPSRLRQKMAEKRFTNAMLAEQAKVSESSIKRALNGLSMTHITIRQIADALGTSESWLTGDEPEIELVEPSPNRAEPPDNDGISESDIKKVLDTLEKAYIERIEDLHQRIEDQKTLYYRSRKECHSLLIFIVTIVVFILIVLAVDILNPNVGWVRK